MCFYNSLNLRTAKIAESDITCFKGLDRVKDMEGNIKLISPYYNKTNWEVGKVKTATIVRVGACIIDKGLHSCKTWGIARNHSRYIYPAVIPKGSIYWENDKEYLSERLIITRKTSFSIFILPLQ